MASMTLPDLYRAARSLEAIENYGHADDPLLQDVKPTDEVLDCDCTFDHDDKFWKSRLLESTRIKKGKCESSNAFNFFGFAVSEWVARVPGLFWTKRAEKLRMLGDQAIQYESPRWTTLHPPGKSAKVLGGIGTMKFPPNERGYHLVTLSAGHNASSGIPVLVSPEAWDAHDISEGCVINLAAKWQPMAAEWAYRFPSIKGIPKGYLMVENASQIHCVLAREQPTQIHPFTVMEYSRGNSLLFDFVYATADTGDQAYRAKLESFFDSYKRDSGRYGRYLLSADIGNPLWDADYDDPASLRGDKGAVAQLHLLAARVRE